MSDPLWWRCPGCDLQYRQEQLLQCTHCGLSYCVSCSRAVILHERLTGRKEGEGWLCVRCQAELGPDGYRPVFQ